MEILRRITCEYVAGDLFPEDLPRVAAEALARGLDSASLRELAGLNGSDDVRDIRALYLAAMEELGIELPDEQTVRWDRVRTWARRMVDGMTTPVEGAAKIDAESVALESPAKLSDFTYLLALWGEFPDRRQSLEASMLESARELVAQSDCAIGEERPGSGF
ncbi:hypothetical protein ACFY4C_31365 [Actinomadura viridis]|uniref:hypothetical protein n=1 Tax=Actinomadura viridis TaxID=58110 RepID=UPI00367FCBB7